MTDAKHTLEATVLAVMSGCTDRDLTGAGAAEAAVTLLQKPFTLRELRPRIREVLAPAGQ